MCGQKLKDARYLMPSKEARFDPESTSKNDITLESCNKNNKAFINFSKSILKEVAKSSPNLAG